MKPFYLLIFLALLSTACQPGCQITGENQAKDGATETGEEDLAATAHHETITIKKQSITSSRYYPAFIEGRQSVKLIPRVEGYIQAVLIKEGQQVKSGQTLFVLDQAFYKAEFKVAKANVAVARSEVAAARLNVESKKKLLDKGIIAEFELLQAKIQLEQAEAHLQQSLAQQETAQTNLSYTIIKSPCAGVVGRLSYRQGDYISPTMTEGLTTIADTAIMYVYFSLTEGEILNLVRQYGSLKQMISAFPPLGLKMINGQDYPLPGRIESISGIVDRQTGALQVRSAFPNPDGILLSGGTGQVIISDKYKDVIVIPQEATYEILNKIHVYKVVGGVAKSGVIAVEPLADGQHYLVKSGLNTGEVIIAKGAEFIQENMVIEVPEPTK